MKKKRKEIPSCPPWFFDRLLKWYCNPLILEDIQGDLYELFQQRLTDKGVFHAKLLFILDVLSLLRPFGIYRERSLFLNQNVAIFLQNHFRLAFRHLKKYPLISSINMLGLAVGFASGLLILLFVQHELSYDYFHQNKDRIFRIATEVRDKDKTVHAAISNTFLSPILNQEFPEIEKTVRLASLPGPATIRVENKEFLQTNIYYADKEVFTVFTYPLAYGNPQTALANPSSIVVSETLAEKLFGAANALGKTVSLNGNSLMVSGVMQDVPSNTDLQISALISFDNYQLDWALTFLLFKEQALRAGFESKLHHRAADYLTEYEEEGIVLTYHLEPLTDLHLSAGKLYDSPKGNRSQIYVFSLIAGFIILLACINYTNLSIAQSFKRIREMGIRKAIGATKSQLLIQLLAESLFLMTLASLLAVVMLMVLLPYFSEMVEKTFQPEHLLQWKIVFPVIGIFAASGVISGLYPASHLISFRPVKVLKAVVNPGWRRGRIELRKGLIVLQFSICMSMLVCTLMVSRQMTFIGQQDLGFTMDRVLSLPLPGNSSTIQKVPALQTDLSKLPEVISGVSLVSANALPGSNPALDEFMVEKNNSTDMILLNNIAIDEHFLDVLDIQITRGRNLLPHKQGHHGELLVNETLVKTIGWVDPIGKKIQSPLGFEGIVVGVIKDFHFRSLHNPIEPLLMVSYRGNYVGSNLLVRFRSDDNERFLNQVRRNWISHIPGSVFDFHFLDQSYNRQYRKEKSTQSVFNHLSLLSLIIAGLGLFGLASILIQHRIKEIGIRKVLGAGNLLLMYLLTKDMVLLVGIAILLASPIAWYWANQWLQGFEYRVDIGPGPFIVAGSLGIVIALIATGIKAFEVAFANPVDALRDE